MQLNMKDYPTNQSKGTSLMCIAVLHLTVTVSSSIVSTLHTIR